MPTKPKLLVKAVNAWARSAFGNVHNWGPVEQNQLSLKQAAAWMCNKNLLNIMQKYERETLLMK